jgi:putative ABC transport system permease protein
VVIGVLGAAVLTRWISSLLFGVAPLDPLTYGAVVAALFGVALVASWVPARRAARVDPAIAMRVP